MLKIVQSTSDGLVIILLAGKLLAPWVDELRANVVAARSQGGLRVSLAELSYADRAGVELLKELQAEGVELSDGSSFINGLLSSAGDPHTENAPAGR